MSTQPDGHLVAVGTRAPQGAALAPSEGAVRHEAEVQAFREKQQRDRASAFTQTAAPEPPPQAPPVVGDVVETGDGFGVVVAVHPGYGEGALADVVRLPAAVRGRVEGGRFVPEAT